MKKKQENQKICKHLWMFRKAGLFDTYYCQKCLKEIGIVRWKDVVEIIDLDKDRVFKYLKKVVK